MGVGLRRVAGLVVVAVVSVLGCEDDASGGPPTEIGGGDGRPDMGAVIPVGGNLAGGAGGGGSGGAGGTPVGGAEAPGGATVGGMASGGGDVPVGGDLPFECGVGEVRCLSEGDPAIERCNADGRWAVDICPDGAPCVGDRCLPSPATCTAGERICLSETQPAACNPGVEWLPTEPCADGEVCTNGRCESPACAAAALQRSYLGCEYWAVDLPNAATIAPFGGTTPDAPTGVVVTNPDLQSPVRVTVTGPDGNLARLVARVRIEPPADIGIGGMFNAETVQSEVRDAQGVIVAENFGQADGVEVPPGGTATLLLPRLVQVSNDSGIYASAFRVRTDRPIAAYQFNPICCNYSFSNDASLLIPTSALGADYRFVGVPSWVSPESGVASPAGMAILGTENGTEVTITLPRGATLARPRRGNVEVNGQTWTLNLRAHEVAMLQTEGGSFGNEIDLSGASITSNLPVSVFSTHQCAFYPAELSACDHLEEQLFPTGTLGQQYVLVPTVSRGRPVPRTEVSYWKIVATDAEDTVVQLSRPYEELRAVGPGYRRVQDCGDLLQPDGQSFVLRGGAVCEFGTQQAVELQASGRLLVMGIISGQESTGVFNAFDAHAGDPSIYLVPPDLQYRNDYAFLTPGTYFNDYLTVVADSDATLVLDGQPLSLADAVPVPGSSRVYKHVTLTDGPHRVQGDQPFGILVFAFDDYVSYAFTGGLNLTKR
jgi:hypothetical protein